MFSAILTFLGTGITDVFDFFGDVMTGGISLFYDSVGTSLTELGELLLIGALVGLALWGISFVRSMIPFLK